MVSLEVDFAGLKLKNPVIVASAPPTETLHNIEACAIAGAGAVITKTSANFNPEGLILGGRRTYVDPSDVDASGLWAQGTFRHETLTIEEGVQLVSQAAKLVDIPIIASVGGLALEPEDWLNSCLAMQDAGASMIQMDLFYVPQPRCSPENIERLKEVLRVVTSRLTIPVAPKLNHDIPVHYAAQILKGTGISAVIATDSLRVPLPVNIEDGGRPLMKYIEGARECSLFGNWQKPLTLQYTSVLYHELGLPISAGGGFVSGADAIEAVMLGATSVQFATQIIRYGFRQITKILKQMSLFMVRNHFESITELRGTAHRYINWDGLEQFEEARAVVDYDLCVDCGRCTRVVFCQDIHLDELGKVKIENTCDGCGLCPTVCPVPGALTVRPLTLMVRE
jgi:dihydroorotate dehydrogenase/Pyruvate/2-oxoacid:ferredoxin oxidoreductase delta subunit